jgi:hypothetical protein
MILSGGRPLEPGIYQQIIRLRSKPAKGMDEQSGQSMKRGSHDTTSHL